MAFDKIIIEGEDILNLIPQKPPMVMVDKLYLYEKKRTISGLQIRESNIFVEDGVLKEPGLTENIAQTAALHTGYLCMEEKKPVPIGFIASIKNLVIHTFPKVGTEIQTEIVIEHDILDFTLIRGTTMCKDELVAECEMKIFIQK